MKRIVFLFLFTGFYLQCFSQQWNGSNNTTSEISRTGKVNIDNTTTVRRLQIGTNTVTNTPDISMSAQAMIETESNMFLNIDSDNNTNNTAFTIGKDSPTTTGYTALFKVHEAGNAYLYSGHYRNYGDGGLYNQTDKTYFYSDDKNYFKLRTDRGLRVASRDNTMRGFIYHNNSNAFGLLDRHGNWVIRTELDSYNSFLVDNNEKMRITKDGRLGVGLTNPSATIHAMTGNNPYGFYLNHTHGKRGLTIKNDYGSSNTILPYSDGRSYLGGREVVLRAGESNLEGFRVKEDGSTKVKSLSHNYSGYLPVYVDKDGNLVTGGRGTTTIPPGLKEDGTYSKKSANNGDVCSGNNSVNSAWTPVDDGLIATSSANENELNGFCIKDRAISSSPWYNNKFVYINREGSIFEPSYGHNFFNYPAQFIVHGGDGHGGMQFSTSNPGSVSQLEFVNQGKQSFWALSNRADNDFNYDKIVNQHELLKDRFAFFSNVDGKVDAPFTVFKNGQILIGDMISHGGGQIEYSLPYGSKAPNFNVFAGHKLSVKGKIVAEEIILQKYEDWADYVFEEDYNLQSLVDVEAFIELNGHLPNIPSAKEIKENGLEATEMFRMHMEKIEELTLHTIEQEKSLKSKEKEIETLEKRIEKLEDLFLNIQNKDQ